MMPDKNTILGKISKSLCQKISNYGYCSEALNGSTESMALGTSDMLSEVHNKQRLKRLLSLAGYMINSENAKQKRLADIGKKPTKRHAIYTLIKMLADKITSEFVINHSYDLYFNNSVPVSFKELMSWDIEKNLTYLTHDLGGGKGDYLDIHDPEILIRVARDKVHAQELSMAVYIKKCIHEVENAGDMVISLAHDPVITSVCKMYSTAEMAVCEDEWVQEKDNHCLYLYLPLGLSIISNGFHSIAAGVLKKEGELRVGSDTRAAVYDMSGLLEFMYFDGTYYRKIADDIIMYKAANFEFGCIFELGRLIVENKIHIGEQSFSTHAALAAL